MTKLIEELTKLADKYKVSFSFDFYSGGADKRYFVLSQCQGGIDHDSTDSLNTCYYFIINRADKTIALETETLMKPIYNGVLSVVNTFCETLTTYKDELFSFLFSIPNLNKEDKEEDKSDKSFINALQRVAELEKENERLKECLRSYASRSDASKSESDANILWGTYGV